MLISRSRSPLLATLSVLFLSGEYLALSEGFGQSNATATITLASTTGPTTGQPGVTSMTLSGSNYPSGTISASQVQLILTPVTSGTGPTASFSPTAITTLYGTSRRLTFTIPATVSVTSPVPHVVTVSGQTASGTSFSSGNSAALTVEPPSQIISISPNTGTQGQSLTATIASQYTNFTQGSTVANFGAGISVGGAPEGMAGPVTVVN